VLLKSGLGPCDELAGKGVECIKHIPGVGKNNLDDLVFSVSHDYLQSTFPAREGQNCPNELFEWLTQGTGVYATPAWISGSGEIGFIPRESNSSRTDISMRLSGSTITVMLSPPTIDAVPIPSSSTSTHVCNFTLTDNLNGMMVTGCLTPSEVDVEDGAYAIEVARRLTRHEPLASYMRETNPGPNVQTREELKNWVRVRWSSFNHGQGICRMGRLDDPMAVVDEKMKFIGVDGLWIADNSIFPAKSSNDVQADAVLAGERGSSFIKEYFGWPDSPLPK